jgi:gas vesicle protein
MSENDHDSNFIALLLGASVGLGLAFLFTPRSGEETRQLIAEKAKEGMECAAEAVEELKMQVGDGLANAGEAAQQLKDCVGETVASLREKVQEAVRAGQDAYQEELAGRDAELGSSLGARSAS